jgi:hypothetical protein
MITGAYAVIFTRDADGGSGVLPRRARAPVCGRGGWLIFALPPAELAAHPADENGPHELYRMCDDDHATIAELKTRGVDVARTVTDEGFGLVTAIQLPGGGELGLYEPRHPTPVSPGPSTS